MTSTTARAAELAPLLRSKAEENDDAGNLAHEVVTAMRSDGLLRMWVPQAYGGLQTPVAESLDALIELGRHDGAAAWCAMIANTTALLAAHLEPDVAEDLFGSPDAIAAGFAQPRGRAVRHDGGLQVSGRWQWGSFTRHATTVGGGARLGDPETGDARALFVFMDPADIEWIDNWQVVGLRGTGSSDYTATEVVVPEGHWVDIGSLDSPVVDDPLYRFSFYGLLAAGVAATAIGIGWAALEAFVRLAAEKQPQGSRRTLAARAPVQAETARAEAAVRGATALLHDVSGRAWERAEAGEPVSVEHRRLLRLAATDATHRCADAVTRLYRLAGGEAVYERCPLEKLFRDVNVATQHAMVSERIFETVGRIALGLETDHRQL